MITSVSSIGTKLHLAFYFLPTLSPLSHSKFFNIFFNRTPSCGDILSPFSHVVTSVKFFSLCVFNYEMKMEITSRNVK